MNKKDQKPVIILGAGGHARVVLDVLTLLGREVLGVVEPNAEVGSAFSVSTVLGDDSVIKEYSPNVIELANGIGGMPNQNLRWHLASLMRSQGYLFTTIIHPSVVIARDVELGEGAQIMAGSIIQSNTKVGKDSIINTGVLVDHDCHIADNCHLAPGVVCSGGVHIASGSHLGTGAMVIQNISIGCHSTIAAGSVIYKDVPDYVLFKQPRNATMKKQG